MVKPNKPLARKAVPKRRMWFLGSTATILVIIAVVVGVVVIARTYYSHNLQPVSSSQSAVIVTIPPGSTLHQIATLLRQKGLIRNSQVFEQYVRSHNDQDKLQAGTYSLQPSQSVSQITTILTHGNILKNLFTILPGQRLDQIKSAMINVGFNASDVDAAFNPDLYAGHGALSDKPAGASLEGFLYPDSFQKTANTQPQTVIRQSLNSMQLHLTPELQAAYVGQGLTVYQAITLASIVEQEVSNPTDKAQVAQVFLTRYRQGMQLGSDVTAFYGAIVAGKTPSVAYDSPYNTRIHAGLPPAPISNVSESSLQAVAHPADTTWLYFVSGDDGKTYFSKTLDEHNVQTNQFCKKLCN
jgi:UPF0755 protein